MNKQSKTGVWNDIFPVDLPKKNQHHQWVFAKYQEAPSQRTDGCWYTVFLFRDENRTIFGKIEYQEYPYINFNKISTKIILERDFRDSLISNDPDLPKIWKRH